MRELNGACSGDQLFEVMKWGGLHLVVTEVVLVGGDDDKKVDFISIILISG